MTPSPRTYNISICLFATLLNQILQNCGFVSKIVAHSYRRLCSFWDWIHDDNSLLNITHDEIHVSIVCLSPVVETLSTGESEAFLTCRTPDNSLSPRSLTTTRSESDSLIRSNGSCISPLASTILVVAIWSKVDARFRHLYPFKAFLHHDSITR